MFKKEVKEVLTTTTEIERDAIKAFLKTSGKVEDIQFKYSKKDYYTNINRLITLVKRFKENCQKRENCDGCPFQDGFLCPDYADEDLIEFLKEI